MVRAVFLHNLHLDKVSLAEGKLTFLTERNHVVNVCGAVEHRGGEEETAGLGGGHVWSGAH